jgi:hypothetical protein
VEVLIFLRPFIWSRVYGLIQYGSDKGTASNGVKISEEVQQRPWKRLNNHSGKKA